MLLLRLIFHTPVRIAVQVPLVGGRVVLVHAFNGHLHDLALVIKQEKNRCYLNLLHYYYYYSVLLLLLLLLPQSQSLSGSDLPTSFFSKSSSSSSFLALSIFSHSSDCHLFPAADYCHLIESQPRFRLDWPSHIEHLPPPATPHRLFGKFSTSKQTPWPAWPPAVSFIQMSLRTPCICSTGTRASWTKKTILFSTTTSSTLLPSTPPQWTTCHGDSPLPVTRPCSLPDSRTGPTSLTTMMRLLRHL